MQIGLQICMRLTKQKRQMWNFYSNVSVLLQSVFVKLLAAADVFWCLWRKPGGMLYIDYNHTYHPEHWFVHSGERIIWQGTDSHGTKGLMSLSNSTYDMETCMIHATRRYELETSTGMKIHKEVPSVKHYVLPEQLHTWLEDAGFYIENEYGDYDGNPISEATGRAIICALFTVK